MTPAEKAVINAAWDLSRGLTGQMLAAMPLGFARLVHPIRRAVEALKAERAAAEETRTWDQVVAEDEIYSTRTEKWYRVVETHKQDGRVMMRTEGMARAKAMDPDARVRVRRSEMGQAVDVWAGLEVISS